MLIGLGVAVMLCTRADIWHWLNTHAVSLTPLDRRLARLFPHHYPAVGHALRIALRSIGFCVFCLGAAVLANAVYG